MSTADDVIDSIDHALQDWSASPDAMRWTPEPAPPRNSLPSRWHQPAGSPYPYLWSAVTSAAVFEEAMQGVRAAFDRTLREVVAETTKLPATFAATFADVHEAENARRSAMHTAYRARARRRTRSHR